MRYFIDTEFLDDGKTIDLISLGIVAEDGRALYTCNLDAELHRCVHDSWMRENVMAKLPPYSDKAWMPRQGNWQVPGIHEAVLSFMLNTENMSAIDRCSTYDGAHIEIWGYYSSYDWVAFCQIFGRMIDLPPQFPKRCRDLKQLADDIGCVEKLPKPEGAHDALVDAKWNRDYFRFLRSRAPMGHPLWRTDGAVYA
jgi:hypothetical protein